MTINQTAIFLWPGGSTSLLHQLVNGDTVRTEVNYLLGQTLEAAEEEPA